MGGDARKPLVEGTPVAGIVTILTGMAKPLLRRRVVTALSLEPIAFEGSDSLDDQTKVFQ